MSASFRKRTRKPIPGFLALNAEELCPQRQDAAVSVIGAFLDTTANDSLAIPIAVEASTDMKTSIGRRGARFRFGRHCDEGKRTDVIGESANLKEANAVVMPSELGN